MVGDQNIATARHGSHDPASVVPDGTPNIGDTLGQGILGDHCVIPDRLHDLVLGNETADVGSEKAQHGEGARPQFHPVARERPNFFARKVDLKARQ
jgi:hypothetical protein